MNEKDILNDQLSQEAEDELQQATSQEDLDRLIKNVDKNVKKTKSNENPFISLAKAQQDAEEKYQMQRRLIDENNRYSKAVIGNSLKYAQDRNNLESILSRDNDLARQHSLGVNSNSLTQAENDALLRSGVDISNDTATLNELERKQKWQSNNLDILMKGNEAYAKSELTRQHQINQLNIKQDYIRQQIDKSRNQLKSMIDLEVGGQQIFNEIMSDIDKRLGLTSNLDKDYTTDALSRLGSGFVESFDEILGSGRILGANDWKAHPLQSLLETIGVMDENKEYIDPYKSQIYNSFFDDSLSLDYVKHKLVAESGYTFGMLLQSAIAGVATGGVGAASRLGVSAGLKGASQTTGLLSKAKAFSSELSKATTEALAKGQTKQAKVLGLFNVAGDSIIGKVANHLLTTQMALYPFRSASRIGDIAKDRLALEGKEYKGLSDLTTHDVAMGATSALMDSVEVPVALLGGNLLRKTSNALLKSEKTSAKVGGALVSLAGVAPTAFVTEGVTEAVSTIAELAGTYGVDFSDVLSALWSDNPKDAEWKYAIQEAMAIGTIMGGGFVSVGSGVQAIEDIKAGQAERKQQAIFEKQKQAEIAKGYGVFARENQYDNKIQSFNAKIDSGIEKGSISKQDGKVLKDSYMSVQRTSQENKSILDKNYKNLSSEINKAKKEGNKQKVQELQAQKKTIQKAYSTIDTMNNQIDKLFDKAIKDGEVSNVKNAINEFQQQLHSNNIQLGDTGLKLNKSFFGDESTTLFSSMRDTFEKNDVASKKEFNSMIKESMKEAKEYGKKKSDEVSTKETSSEAEVSNQKSKEQESEAKKDFIKSVDRNNVSKNKLQDSINKNKKKNAEEVKSREEQIVENNKNREEIEKDGKTITSINNKLIDASADESINDKELQDKLLDSAVYSDNKTLSQQLSHFIRRFKSINQNSNKSDIKREFKDKLHIELTLDEINKVYEVIHSEGLYLESLSYEKEIVVRDSEGNIKQTIKENVYIIDIIKQHNQSMYELENGIEELHQKILNGENTEELKKDLKQKIDDMNLNLQDSIQLATTNQLFSENRAIVKTYLIQVADRANKIINQYRNYSNMLEERVVKEILPTLSDDNLIAKVKTILNRFAISLKRLIDNFESFVKQSKDIKKDLTTLSNDIKEVVDDMNKVLATTAIIQDFKTSEDFKAYNVSVVKEELGLKLTNGAVNNILRWNKLLERNFDFSATSIKNCLVKLASAYYTDYYNANRKEKHKFMYPLSIIFGKNVNKVLSNVNDIVGKDKKINYEYNKISSAFAANNINVKPELLLKALTLAMIKTISTERQQSKLFGVDVFKIVDNVQIEAALKNELKEMTGIDLSNNPKMVSFLLAMVDTFMKHNQKIKYNYVSFTASESSFNTAKILGDIIDDTDLSKFKRTTKDGKKYLKRIDLAEYIVSQIQNKNQREFLTKHMDNKRNGKTTKTGNKTSIDIDYAIENYANSGDIFDFTERLQRILFKDSEGKRAETKVFLGMRIESSLSPITEFLKISQKENEKAIYNILHNAVKNENSPTIQKANNKRYILNQSKLQVFKEQFGEEALNLEEVEGLTEKGHKLLLDDYIDNPAKEFDRDNPLFYVPVQQYDENGFNSGVKYYKLLNNPKLIQALALENTIKDFRESSSSIRSKELSANYASKVQDVMKDIGVLYSLFKYGNKPFHMNYDLQATNRLYMPNSTFNTVTNKLLREFTTLEKMDIVKDNPDVDYNGEEKISDKHRLLIRNILLFATLDSSYDKTPFKTSDNNTLQWIIKDKEGKDITEQALSDIDSVTDMIINGNKEQALSKIDELIARQDNKFDFTDDGNLSLTNLLVLKNAVQKGSIIPNDTTIELDGLTFGISESLQHMNSAENIAMMTSTQKFFVVDNKIYSGYLNKLETAKAKMNENPTFDNIMEALKYDIYGSTLNKLYQSLKGLNANTGNVYLDTLTNLFTQDTTNPNKVFKSLRELGKKLVLGPNYGQAFTSMIKSMDKETIKNFVLEQALKDFDSTITNAIKEQGIENATIEETINGIIRNDNVPAYMKGILTKYLNSLSETRKQQDFSANTIGDYLLFMFKQEQQNSVIEYLGNNFDIGLLSDKAKQEINQNAILGIKDTQNKMFKAIENLEKTIKKEENNIDFEFENARQVIDKINQYIKKNESNAKTLKSIFGNKNKLFHSLLGYYFSNAYRENNGENGFVVKSLNDFKETGNVRNQLNQAKSEILQNTVRTIKDLTFKPLVAKYKDKIAYFKQHMENGDISAILTSIDNAINNETNLNEFIPYLSFVSEAQEEVAEACEKTYQKINEFIGSKYEDASNIHLTFKKEKTKHKDKKKGSATIANVLDEYGYTTSNVSIRQPRADQAPQIYHSTMQNINMLENYASVVINLMEHDIEANMMNDTVLDDTIGASFSIFDGIFVRPDMVTKTAQKINTKLGESRLVNKDFSTIATILRLENHANEFLNSLRNANNIVKDASYNNDSIVDNSITNSIFASEISQNLFKYDKENQLLNYHLLNNTIIIETDMVNKNEKGYMDLKGIGKYKVIVVQNGTLNSLKQGDKDAIEIVLHELYHTSTWNTFSKAKKTQTMNIEKNIVNELQKKFDNLKGILFLRYKELYNKINDIEEGYKNSNNPFSVEIISNVFALPEILFDEVPNLKNEKEYKDLLSIAQQVVQYSNFNEDNKQVTGLKFNGKLFDFTSKNNPINMRVIDLEVKNSYEVKNDNGYNYSINQMTFGELKNSPLINFLAKSNNINVDKNILPLAVSKIFAINNAKTIQSISDNDIMLGRNFIIDMNKKDGVKDSFLDNVFDDILNKDNYSLIDAYLAIKERMDDEEIHFIPQTILSEESLAKCSKEQFEDFLSVLNSAMYNKGFMLDNSYQSNEFTKKNIDNQQKDEYKFGDVDYSPLSSIKKATQKNARDEVVNNIATENNSDDNTPSMYRKSNQGKKKASLNKIAQSIMDSNRATILNQDEANSFIDTIFRTNKVRDSGNRKLFDKVQKMIKKSINNGNTKIYFTRQNIDNGVMIVDGNIFVNEDIAKGKISDRVIQESFKNIIENIINSSNPNTVNLTKIGKIINGFYHTIIKNQNLSKSNESISNFVDSFTKNIESTYATIANKIKNSTIADKLLALKNSVYKVNHNNTVSKNYLESEKIKDDLYAFRDYLENNFTFLDENTLNEVKSFLDTLETRIKLFNATDFVSESLINPDMYSYIRSDNYADTIQTMFDNFEEAYGKSKTRMDVNQPLKSILKELDFADVSYQLRANQQARKSMQNVKEYINLNNSANQEVTSYEAINVIDNYYSELNDRQKELLSPIMDEIKNSVNDTTIIVSDLLNDSAGMSFTYNNKKYIILSSQNVEQNTLAHELGHTILDSVFKNEESIAVKNAVSDIRYLQSYIMEELRQNEGLMTELGLMNDGKTNAVFDEVFSKPNEFIMYFLFDKEKLDILSNFTLQDLNSKNYQQPKSIVGRVFKLLSSLIKKVTELLSLKNTNRNTQLDKYLSDNFIKIANLNNPELLAKLDNTFYNKLQMGLNTIVTDVFAKVPILQSMQNVDKWIKQNGYTQEQVDEIIKEIKEQYNEQGFLSSIINYDYKGVFKPLAVLRFLNILNPMYYKSPLHRTIALQMLNRTLNASNNFIAKELGRILRDFGIISIDNQSEIENLLGQKLSLDQMKAKTNQFISETYKDAREKILGENATKLEEDELQWTQPIERDPYNLNHFSPKEMFERSLGSIIGELQIGKGFNDTGFLNTSKVGLRAVVDNLFDNSDKSIETLDKMIEVIKNEMIEVINNITDNTLSKEEKEANIRTFMRKLEILGYTRLTNQVSDSSIENQAEIVRQASKNFKDSIRNNLYVKQEGLINKMEQLTTLFAIKHIKIYGGKDITIGKYQKQIDFVKQYIDFEDGKISDNSFVGLSVTSSLHTSLMNESQQYEALALSKENIDYINQLREENAQLLSLGEMTEDIRERINQNNEAIENIIEISIRDKEDFEQNDYTKDYSRDGYTKYAYNRNISDLVSIQYMNPEVYSQEEIKYHYNELADNNKMDTYQDVVEYKLGLGYSVLDDNGDVITDRSEIDKLLAAEKTIVMRYEGKFGYSSKFTPYSFIGVKNKTAGSLLSDNVTLTEKDKEIIAKKAEERFEAEQDLIDNAENFDFDLIRNSMKRNFMEYRYSTNADTQLRTKQSRFMIEKMSKLDNSIEQQLLGLENSIFQKKNADRFNTKLALAILDDNKIIHSSPSELKNAQENYIKILDLESKDFGNPELMLGGNVYSVLLKTLFRHNQDKPVSEQIKQLYISQDNAEYLLGVKADRLSVKATKNTSNAVVRKFLNRIEGLFDTFWNDVKETVLIRNPKVLYMNIMSNFSSLTQLGLSIPQIAERSQAIEKELEMWENDLKAYSEAQNRLSILLNNKKATKEQIDKYNIEINNLENRLLNNRVFYPMMNGVDSNIVDETVVNVNEIDNVLRNGVNKLLEKSNLKGKISQSVVNNLILSQSSDIYKKAMKFNRYGDIIPRVIAYEMFKTKENLDNQSAINKAQDMFVNYNIPITSRFLMFLEKIGMQQFVRFNVRVQRTAAMNFMQYPVSTLSTILGANFLQSTLPFGEYLIVDPLSSENAINKNYNLFGMLSRNLTPFYRWTGFSDILNAR